MAQWKDYDHDEFFGSVEDDDDDNDSKGGRHGVGDKIHVGLAVAERNALHERHHNLGYHEAYDASKEERLQQGFDDGYEEAFKVFYRIGKMLGNSAMSHKLAEQTESGLTFHDTDDAKYVQAARVLREQVTQNDDAVLDLKHVEEQVSSKLLEK